LEGLGTGYVGIYQLSVGGLTKIDLFTGSLVVLATPSMNVFSIALFPNGTPNGPPPPAPSTFTASDDQPDGVHLAWTAVPEALTYRLYRDGQPIATVQSPATSYIDSPTLGDYTYCIEALNLGGPSPQVCDEGSRRAYRSSPEIRIARDVPNDEGGKIALAWLRSEYDSNTGGTVTGYRIWRRLPFSEAPQVPGFSGPGTAARRIQNGQQITFWEPLATLPSAALEGYGIVVSTTQDSLADANPYTAFFVSALTADAHVFYDSAVDSAYSVDNLAPAPPQGIQGTFDPQTGVTLHWLPNREADLARYNLYRGSDVDFPLSTFSFVGSTTDTVIATGASPGSYYKLSAVDIHGNESAPATLAPTDLPTTVLVSNLTASVEGRRVRIELTLARGDERFTALLYRAASESFAEASLLPVEPVLSTGVRIELFDDTAEPGTVSWYWVQLVGQGGTVVLAGPIAATPGNAPEFTAIAVPQPNPMRSTTTLRFTVGVDAAELGSAPCRIDVFNVQGRRIRALESGTRVAGSYEVVWDGKNDSGVRAPAGVYYVRLAVGSFRKSSKLVVMQ
jgi:hypothetical protein